MLILEMPKGIATPKKNNTTLIDHQKNILIQSRRQIHVISQTWIRDPNVDFLLPNIGSDKRWMREILLVT